MIRLPNNLVDLYQRATGRGNQVIRPLWRSRVKTRACEYLRYANIIYSIYFKKNLIYLKIWKPFLWIRYRTIVVRYWTEQERTIVEHLTQHGIDQSGTKSNFMSHKKWWNCLIKDNCIFIFAFPITSPHQDYICVYTHASIDLG